MGHPGCGALSQPASVPRRLLGRLELALDQRQARVPEAGIGEVDPDDPAEVLGRLVGVDLADPGFWKSGLALVERQLEAAEQAAREAGRL